MSLSLISVGLIRAADVVTAHDAGFGRRSLRPVNPSVLGRELFREVVAGREPSDERVDRAGLRIDDHDARAVVLPFRLANGLIRNFSQGYTSIYELQRPRPAARRRAGGEPGEPSAPRAADGAQSFVIVTTWRWPRTTGAEPGRFGLATKGLVGSGAFRLSS